MNDVKEISLLPINSYELEEHLTELGLSLLQFSKDYNFSKKFSRVDDCDFIQSVIIEFIAEIKTDFIAFYGISEQNLIAGTTIRISAAELPEYVTREAVFNAIEAKLNVPNNSRYNSWFNVNIRNRISSYKKSLYELRNGIRDQFVKTAETTTSSSDSFRLMLSTYHVNNIFTLTPIQDKLNERTDIDQYYMVNRYETYKKLISLGYRNILYGRSAGLTQSTRSNDAVCDDFVKHFFENHFMGGKATNHFKVVFLKKLKEKLNFAVRLYAPIKNTIVEIKPKCILVSSGSTIDAQIIIHVASSLKIKIIEMTHGIFHDTPILKFQNIPIKLVWNKHQFDLMRKYKPEVKCYITGNPKHDELLRKYNSNPPLKLYDKPYIVFASTPGNNISISWVTYLAILYDYIKLANENRNLICVFKLHPSEDKDRIQKEALLLGAPNNLIIEKEANIYELIYNAELVIVVTSTVGYEALLFNKKIICFKIQNSEKWMPLSDFSLAKSADNFETLNSSVQEWLQQPLNANPDAKSYFVHSDGHAIENTIKMILNNDK